MNRHQVTGLCGKELRNVGRVGVDSVFLLEGAIFVGLK